MEKNNDNLEYFLKISESSQNNKKINDHLRNLLTKNKKLLENKKFYEAKNVSSEIENILKSNKEEFTFTEFFPNLHPELLTETPYIEKNLKKDPTYLTLHYLGYATAYFYLEEYEQAINFFKKTVNLINEHNIKLTDFQTNYGNICYYIASAYKKLNKNEEAIEYLNIVIKNLKKSKIIANNKKQLIKLYFERGKLNIILEKNKKAKEDFEKIIELFERNIVLIKNQIKISSKKICHADANNTLNQSEKIISDLREININLDKTKNKKSLAEIYFECGQLNIIFKENQQAKNYFYKAIDLNFDPNFRTKCYYNIGIINLSIGELENAKNNFEKIIQINNICSINFDNSKALVNKSKNFICLINKKLFDEFLILHEGIEKREKAKKRQGEKRKERKNKRQKTNNGFAIVK